MDKNDTVGFQDPFAGTPKAATKTSYGRDEEERNGVTWITQGL